jgi:ferredoxin
MATVITEECINCGACEPECPNTAIYQGGVEYDLDGSKVAALNEEIFYIVPEKCTECVGFFDYEACAAVCPVDCCVPDPDRPESEDALLQRAREIHPDKEFGADFPSRFREGAGAPPAAEPAAAAPAAAATAAVAAAPAAAAPAASAAGLVARVERVLDRPTRTLKSGDPTIVFDGELDMSFDEVLGKVRRPNHSGASTAFGFGLVAAMPLLGALDHETKKGIEQVYGDHRFFSAQLSTAVNVVHNFVLYPVAFAILAYLVGSAALFTESDRGWIFLGLLVATLETLGRLSDGIFRMMPADRMRYGASLYGAPLGIVLKPLVRSLLKWYRGGHVPVEGFYTSEFESKREREKRYGEVYTVEESDNGYYIRMELPREIPPSAAKEELGLGDEMPDYEIKLALTDQGLTVRGSVADPDLRAVCGVSPAFPADFRTEIPTTGRLTGYRHRYADKVLEVAVLRQGA